MRDILMAGAAAGWLRRGKWRAAEEAGNHPAAPKYRLENSLSWLQRVKATEEISNSGGEMAEMLRLAWLNIRK